MVVPERSFIAAAYTQHSIYRKKRNEAMMISVNDHVSHIFGSPEADIPLLLTLLIDSLVLVVPKEVECQR